MASPPSPDPFQNIFGSQDNKILTLHGYVDIFETSFTPFPPIAVFPEPKPDDLRAYQNRLRTFNAEWKLDFITPHRMARAGLYYLGVEDRVKCVFCCREFSNWQPTEDPLVTHKHKSPMCKFFNGTQGYDMCNDDKLDSHDILQQIEAPKHKEFVMFRARLKTFNKCLKNLYQDIHTLCTAGFFYTGDGQNDMMSCFCCDQGIRNWEEGDDPWTEHARWSPNCLYVLLSKGEGFVQEAMGMIKDDPKISQEARTSQVNLTKKNDDGQSIKSEKNQVKTSPSRKNELLYQQQDLSTTPDSLLCKICFKGKLEAAFISCFHVVSCMQCAKTLDQCPVCRQHIGVAVVVNVNVDGEKYEDLAQLQCSSFQCSGKPLDPMLCKVCHKEEMGALFLPCRDIYACIKCASGMDECPMCSLSVCGTEQVYL